jgi:hypothetical protein
VVALLTLAAGCNSDNSTSTAPQPTPKSSATATKKPPTGPPTVTITHNKVTPATLEVEGGATVTIRNDDSVGHRLDNRPNHIYSGTIPAKRKGELTMPPDSGSYVFADPYNSAVRVKIRVR